ncbi:MAG: thiamine biosynthesis protein ThiF [Actinobacteria bacterium]|nr:thiamine biosynthesis protein ThiF [Actinomycetota bacterium]
MTVQQPESGTDVPPATTDSDPEPPPTSRRLNRAAVVLWRSRRSVQLELGDRRIVVAGVEPEQLSALLWRPAGSLAARPSPARTAGLAELTALLDAAGFLTTAPGREGDLPALPARLSAELGALAAQFGDEAVPALRTRRKASVAVHGTSRLATVVASILAAAGVGWIQLVQDGEVAAGDSCPGGVTPADEGRRFARAAAEAVRRYAPDVDTGTAPPGHRPDLVLLTDPVPLDPALRGALHHDEVAHLPASVDGRRAVVGPLVLPGRTSCLNCADLHRTERDPAWPMLAVQLAGRPRRRIGSDVALCLATAGVAAGQALAHLDRQRPATLAASLEWQWPDWRLRRRSWPAHYGCDCGATTAKAFDPAKTAE